MTAIATIIGLTVVIVAVLLWDTMRRALRSQELRAELRLEEAQGAQLEEMRKEYDARITELEHQQRRNFDSIESVVAGTNMRIAARGRR